MTERTPTTKQIAKWLGILGLAYLALFASLWAYAHYSSSPFREEKKRETEDVVQRFHEGYNARQIARICDEALACGSADLRGVWDSYLNQVRDRAGSFRTIRSSSIQVSIEPADVRATFVSAFEKGEATEFFILHEVYEPPNDGIPGPLKIMAYRIEINGKTIGR